MLLDSISKKTKSSGMTNADEIEYTRKRISSWKMDYSRGLLKSILA